MLLLAEGFKVLQWVWVEGLDMSTLQAKGQFMEVL